MTILEIMSNEKLVSWWGRKEQYNSTVISENINTERTLEIKVKRVNRVLF